jgi:hypothetical protein
LQDVIDKASRLEDQLRRLDGQERAAAGPIAAAEREVMQSEHACQTAKAELDRLGREAAELAVQRHAHATICWICCAVCPVRRSIRRRIACLAGKAGSQTACLAKH